MTDTASLKAAIVAKGYTQDEVASMIPMSYASFNYKLHNKREFKASEIKKICEILDLHDAHIFLHD